MKYLKVPVLICALGLLYSSCVKKANYPDVPAITYSSFTPYYVGSSAVVDSALLRINFTDGNGDIGYPSQQEGVSPDLYVIPMLYYYATNDYRSVPFNDSIITFTYNIPYITPSGNDKELNGIIQVNFEGFIQTLNNLLPEFPGLDTIIDPHRFELKVWIFDRAGNKSNILITPVIHTRPE